MGVRARAGVTRRRLDRGPVRPLRRRQVARAERDLHDDLAGDRGAARRGRSGDSRGGRGGGRCSARGVRKRLVGHRTCRAGEVPLPHRAHPAGALARVRRARVAERRQADQGVPRRRPAARRRTLLLLRGLGRQARVRVSQSTTAPGRRGGADHPVELPAADALLEDRARPGRGQHGRPQARGDDAAVRAVCSRTCCGRRSCRRVS